MKILYLFYLIYHVFSKAKTVTINKTVSETISNLEEVYYKIDKRVLIPSSKLFVSIVFCDIHLHCVEYLNNMVFLSLSLFPSLSLFLSSMKYYYLKEGNKYHTQRKDSLACQVRS